MCPAVDRTAMVTGASRGIGAATARALPAAGARGVLAARDPAPPDRVADDITDAGGQVLLVRTDLTEEPRVVPAWRSPAPRRSPRRGRRQQRGRGPAAGHLPLGGNIILGAHRGRDARLPGGGSPQYVSPAQAGYRSAANSGVSRRTGADGGPKGSRTLCSIWQQRATRRLDPRRWSIDQGRPWWRAEARHRHRRRCRDIAAHGWFHRLSGDPSLNLSVPLGSRICPWQGRRGEHHRGGAAATSRPGRHRTGRACAARLR